MNDQKVNNQIVTKKERIHYIDFMKGLCIILIVINHVDNHFFDIVFPGLPNLNYALESFRIPLYFFLSGLFFKTYSGFSEFLRKKVNNLIITLFFFHFLCAILKLPLVIIANILRPGNEFGFGITDIIPPIFGRFWKAAGAIWFLAALFGVNVIFYAFRRFLNNVGIIIAAIVGSIIGYILMKYKITLPFEFDIALVALPYFTLGWGIKNAGFLKSMSADKWGFIVIVPCAILIYLYSSEIQLIHQNVPNYFMLYAIPFLAILSLFWVSKNLGKIPLISYYGRYSVIIVGTHQLIISYLSLAVRGFLSVRSPIIALAIFIIVMLAELIIIPTFVRYLPRFTAQKDFFLPGWKLS